MKVEYAFYRLLITESKYPEECRLNSFYCNILKFTTTYYEKLSGVKGPSAMELSYIFKVFITFNWHPVIYISEKNQAIFDDHCHIFYILRETLWETFF